MKPLVEQLATTEIECKKLLVEGASNLVMLTDNTNVLCVYYFCIWSKCAITCIISIAKVIPLFRVTFGSRVVEEGSICKIIADSNNSLIGC